MTRTLFATLVGLVLAAGPVTAVDQDSLAAARELYASAAYEDALNILNRLRSAGVKADEGSSVEQYRVLCLLALGRSAEANDAIEAVVTADPLYRPSDSDVSPRVRTAFTEVRRRMLPAIIQQRYAQAKATFDRKDYAAALEAFSQLLNVFADSDLGPAADQPPMADLRTLAAGFQELSAKAMAPPPPSPNVATAAPALTRAPTTEPRVFSPADSNVVPPSTIRQDLPAFTSRIVAPVKGAIEVVIDEVGAVESVTIRESVNRAYDAQVIEVARKWRYAPAMLDGTPVKYRKTVGILISATSLAPGH